MMSDSSEEDIREKIEVFLEPEETRVHGRPIYPDKMEDCDCKTRRYDVRDETWKKIQELHLRLDNFVSGPVSKCFESKEYSFIASPPE